MVVGCCRKPHIRPVEIASFSSQDFSRSNKHDTFWYVVSTGYFYVLFLWVITIKDFRPLEIYRNLGFPLSTITFTVNSHANNHFFKCICFKYYTVWNYFFLLKNVKVFYIQIWFKCETQLLFFLIAIVYRKSLKSFFL